LSIQGYNVGRCRQFGRRLGRIDWLPEDLGGGFGRPHDVSIGIFGLLDCSFDDVADYRRPWRTWIEVAEREDAIRRVGWA
jgi:hypothetical protein